MKQMEQVSKFLLLLSYSAHGFTNSQFRFFKRIMLKKPDKKYLVTCSSDQTLISESTNPESIL